MTVRVAVLIVNYRTYDALDRCLTSLRGYIADDDEVVVVDWVSDPVLRESVAGRHRWARFIPRTDNRGFSAGVNLAASVTSAPVLLLLNPDTEVQWPIVRALSSWLESSPDTAAVGPRVLNTNGTTRLSHACFLGSG